MWRTFEHDGTVRAAHDDAVLRLLPIERVEEMAEGSPLAPRDGRTRVALIETARYLRGLTAGNPALGRRGAVCPFMSIAIARGMLHLAACMIEPGDRRGGVSALDAVRGGFPPLDRLDDFSDPEMLRSVVIVFPAMNDGAGAAFVEGLQRQLKTSFVEAGLMIGEFYPGCPTGGLHNDAFPALDAPQTALAVRRLTVHDAPFMLGHPDWLRAYLNRFGETGHAQVEKARAARHTRATAAAR